MIIILPEADGSNCGLGQIDLPLPMQDETLQILSKMTRYNEYSAQTVALNKFIYELKEAGLYEKVGMFMPFFMCGNISQLSYDAISDSVLTMENAGTYDATTDTITIPSGISNYSHRFLLPSGMNLLDNFVVFSQTKSTFEETNTARDGYYHGPADTVVGSFRVSNGTVRTLGLVQLKVSGQSYSIYESGNTAIATTDANVGTCYVANLISNPISSTKINGYVDPNVSSIDLSSYGEPTKYSLGRDAGKTYSIKSDFLLMGDNTTLTDSEQLALFTSVRKLRQALDAAEI